MILQALVLGIFGSVFGPAESLRSSLWLSPLVFAVHSVEDAPGLAEWMRRTQLFDPVSRGQLIIALLIFIIVSAICAVSARAGARWGEYGLAWMQVFIFLHGIAHVIAAAWFLEYVPGLVTGVLLLPISILLYGRLRRLRPFGRKAGAALIISAVLLYDPVLRLTFKAGALVLHEHPRRKAPADGIPNKVAALAPSRQKGQI